MAVLNSSYQPQHPHSLWADAHRAQAARRQPVYQCLVEGCPKLCTSVGHRRQHLADSHQFPSNYDLSRMHLMLHGGQLRPQEQFGLGRGKAQRAPAASHASLPGHPGPAQQHLGPEARHNAPAGPCGQAGPADQPSMSAAQQQGVRQTDCEPADSGQGAGSQTPSEADELAQLTAGIAGLDTGNYTSSGRRGRGRSSGRGRWFGVQQRGR